MTLLMCPYKSQANVCINRFILTEKSVILSYIIQVLIDNRFTCEGAATDFYEMLCVCRRCIYPSIPFKRITKCISDTKQQPTPQAHYLRVGSRTTCWLIGLRLREEVLGYTQYPKHFVHDRANEIRYFSTKCQLPAMQVS